MKSKNELGKKLKEIRKKKDLRIKEVAESLNISPSRYSNYESGYSTPPKNILVDLERVFGIDLTNEINNYETDKEDLKIKNQYLKGFKNETEQLMIYDQIFWIRDYIDNIQNFEIRRSLANNFSLFLNTIKEFSSIVDSNDYEILNRRKEVETKLNDLLKRIMDTIEDIEINKIS